jgi:all-trans-8'-apo-beta-carotenal 15,15'-oxygenase
MLLSRRKLLKSMSVAGAAACALPLTSQVMATSKSPEIVNYKSLFKNALADNPSLIGFSNVAQNFKSSTMRLEGKLPADLAGSLFRNGPAKFERANIRYHHLFEGDGMIQQFRFDNGNIVHRGRFINTTKYAKEEQAKQFLYSGPDTKVANSLAVTSNDTVNTANTNVIPVGDDLWALWEAGSPTKIDDKTLEAQGFVDLGENTKYSSTLKGLPFSAHPKIDSNGDIFNFGLHPSGQVVVYHLSPKGKVKNVALVNTNFRGGMMHDFLITQRHILLILPSLSTNSLKGGYFERMEFNKKEPMRVLVVDKNTLKISKQFELPSAFVFHFGNAWEDRDGSIRFDASLYSNADVIQQLSRVMTGEIQHDSNKAKTAFITLHANGSTSLESFESISEFPRVASHLTGIKNTYLYHLSAGSDALWSDSVSRTNVDSGKEDTYRYGADFLVEEHVPVCPKADESKGYLVGTALHIQSKRTCINVFDINNLAAGPIARGWLPYHLPLGFHGNFKEKN